MAEKEFTLSDMLRLGAEISTLKAHVASLEKERDERLTDPQIEEFASKLFFSWAVWYHDQQTRGQMGPTLLIQRLQGYAPFNVTQALRDYRRFG